MSGADELAHLMKHAASQETNGYRSAVYGHIASYDDKLHRVRVLIPSMRDDTGNPALSGWMPLGAVWAGPNGTGMQVAPYGGATLEEPTAGELCLVQLIERQRGVTASAHLIYNNNMLPPGATEGCNLLSGECIMVGPGGSKLRFHQSGDLELGAARDLLLSAVRNISLTAAVDVALAATMNVTVNGQQITMTGADALAIVAAAISLGSAGEGLKAVKLSDNTASTVVMAG